MTMVGIFVIIPGFDGHSILFLEEKNDLSEK
jgi:hypothetical protein